MKRIWRTFFLSAGLLASGNVMAPAREVIARTPHTPAPVAENVQPAASPSPPRHAAYPDHPVPQGSESCATPESRPLAVRLDNPRVIAVTGTNTAPAVMPAAFNAAESAQPRPLIRAQKQDFRAMPMGPGPGAPAAPAIQSGITGQTTPETLPSPTPVISTAPPGGPTFVSAPPFMASGPAGFTEGCCDMGEGGGNTDLFGVGDGTVDCYNNIFYLESDTLIWWLSGSRAPALATVGAGSAVIGSDPSATVLLGNSSLGKEEFTGYRVRAGLWFNRDHGLGLEGSYFFLGEETSRFATSSPGMPTLAVPFSTGLTETALPIAQLSPLTAGSILASLETRMWGGEVNLRRGVWAGERLQVDALGGFRFMGLDDNLELTANSTTMAGAMVGTMRDDRFSTRNRFYGGQFGAHTTVRWRSWSLELITKLGLGGTNRQVNVGGNTLVNGVAVPGGGIFARTTNSGRFESDKFSVIPEVGINLGLQLTDSLRLRAGYSFIYWSEVVRPGEQIDRVLGGGRPAVTFNSSDLWVHGLNLGMEWRY